jgi:hypothetical protein
MFVESTYMKFGFFFYLLVSGKWFKMSIYLCLPKLQFPIKFHAHSESSVLESEKKKML